ncbi:MAG: RsmD family RNA methyltransferase [Proteobacteria bacterium]|nr:RsmD family RNA methyltransferase [Pseudomonadota bacterium]
MQIISGKYRGRRLALSAAARPTQNRARIALFNMLDNVCPPTETLRVSTPPKGGVIPENEQLPPWGESQSQSKIGDAVGGQRQVVVWDAFAGSGAFGIEFLSRGAAKSVIFTDTDAESVKTIRRNLVGIDGNVIVKHTDANAAADQFGKIADIIFIDPPYALFETGERLVAKLSEIARPGVVIIWEMPKNAQPKIAENLSILRDKTYGAARFLILTNITIHE